MEGLSLEVFCLANSTTVLTTIPVDLPLPEGSMKISSSLKPCDKLKEHQEQWKFVLLGKRVILSHTHFNILEIQAYAIRQERKIRRIQTGRKKQNYLWPWISDYLYSVKDIKKNTLDGSYSKVEGDMVRTPAYIVAIIKENVKLSTYHYYINNFLNEILSLKNYGIYLENTGFSILH